MPEPIAVPPDDVDADRVVDLVATLRTAGCVFAEDEARLLRAHARTPAELALLTRRRLAGEPLEHVLGWAEFAGLRVAVEPGVFVPRHRSEFLVDEAVGRGPRRARRRRPLLRFGGDRRRPRRRDSCAASSCTPRTSTPSPSGAPAAPSPAGARCTQGDLFAALPPALRGRVDLLVASTPYVPSDAVRLMPPEAREHEPLVALDGGRDGLDVVRRLIAEAPAWLAPAGVVAVETSYQQAATAHAAMAAADLAAEVRVDDDAECVAVLGRRLR